MFAARRTISAGVLSLHRDESSTRRHGRASHEYRWSSYGANAHGLSSAIIEANPLYTQLGETADLRASAYRELFRYQLDPGLVDQIRSATNGNYALGNARFASEVEQTLGRRAVRGKAGRPKRSM